MVSAQAALGDVVPPRQRGRYTGLFIAIFGAASVAGPLLGGFITTHLSWQWIFYINIPLGFVAFAVLAATFPSVARGARHTRSTTWAPLLLAAGPERRRAAHHPGRDHGRLGRRPMILCARRGGAPVAGGLRPGRAPRGRADPAARGSGATAPSGSPAPSGLIIGFSLFGAVTFLPLFQQVVRGQSPTASGLQLLPLMAGLMLSSVVSGRLIARTGRYRQYPIAGTAITVVGLLLLSTMDPDTPVLTAAAFMAVLGLGLGMVMQVLILAVQNDCALRGPRGRDRGRHALSLDRRLARHRHPRRGLHQPSDHRAEHRPAGRRRRGGRARGASTRRGGRPSGSGARRLPRRLRRRAHHGLPGRRRGLGAGLRPHLADPRGPAADDAARRAGGVRAARGPAPPGPGARPAARRWRSPPPASGRCPEQLALGTRRAAARRPTRRGRRASPSGDLDHRVDRDRRPRRTRSNTNLGSSTVLRNGTASVSIMMCARCSTARIPPAMPML